MAEEIKVLYVEDNEFDAFFYKSRLEACELSEFKVKVVVDLAETKQALQQKYLYDIILLDLNLPDSAGLNTLSAVMETGLTIPVVVLSGSGDGEMFKAAREMGASGFLLKKPDNYNVGEHLKRVLDKNRTVKKGVGSWSQS